MRPDYKFLGATLLSALASLVFGALLIIGVLALCADNSADVGTILPGLQMITIRIFGGCAALTGLLGLLFARAVVLLIEIEKNSRSAPLPRASSSATGADL